MSDTEQLDLDPFDLRVGSAGRVLMFGPYERVDWVSQYAKDVFALITELRRLRKELGA